MNKLYDIQKIAKRIRFVRTDIAKMDVKDFADAVGTTDPNIRRWEYGQHLPSLYFVFMLCSEFDVSANWLLGLTDRR